MLFRGPHESGDVGAVGARTDSEYSGDEDETCSTSGRSYTSAESATAQSFELRMAQLDGHTGIGSGTSSNNNNMNFPADSGSSARKLLSPGYQLFSTGDSAYGAANGDGKHSGGSNNLTLVDGTGDGERNSGALRAGTRANDYPDEDERDDDYLTALLSNIERHAARLDTQFFRYPSAETLKQQMAAQTAAQEARAKASPTAGGTAKSANAGAAEATAKVDRSNGNAAPSVDGGAAPAATTAPTTGTAASPPAATKDAAGASHSTGTKLFLGGLRYEVIQSGRHMVSWIFQVACGVHINPTSILIHRKTKNGRSNVAPTGCASVFVADDGDVATLLEMNQRIYCAEEGVYVSPSPDVMKELIASKDIVDVTGGRVRGPTHPVVIERAYSVSHHHGHHGAAGNSNSSTATAAPANTPATTATAARGHGNAGAAGGNSGGAHRHARSPSTISLESNLSNQLMGGMPPPYGGAMPPQYSASTSPSVSGAYQPPSYTPSSVSSSSLGAPAMGVPMMAGTGAGFPPGAMLMSGQSSRSQTIDDGRGSNGGGALKLDPQRVTFHAYLRNASGSRPGEQSHAQDSATAAKAHTVLFLAALPCDATEEYVSWLFSLMSITLPTSRIHPIGGSGAAPSSAAPSLGSADCCATVSVSEGDVSIALNYHHRVLCTSRGAWVGHSAQDIAALRASDASLRDAAVLHVDRRMSAPVRSAGAAGSGGGGMLPPMGGGYAAYPPPLAVGGGRHGSAAAASMPPPPASYPHMFGAMPMPGAVQPGQGGMMPMAAPWGYAAPPSRPGMPGEAMYTHLPPPPNGLMSGSGVPTMATGAMPMPSMVAPGSGYSMPPPPPPFSFTQSVTIGDRTYQLPPGATVQYVPVITPSQSMGAPGDATPSKALAGKSTSSPGSTGGHESVEASTGQHGSSPPRGAASHA